jgi:hypothetical protein
MNNFIKQVIEEKFASKAQQKFFYAKSNEKGSTKKEKEKWGEMAKEFSKKTDFKKIPDKIKKDQNEEQFDEIVDSKGNIARSKKPSNFNVKGITQKKTSDDVVKTGTSQMGSYGGVGTQPYRRYWGEADMSKSLGYNDTLGDDENIKKAYRHFRKELGLTHDEAMKKLSTMGYDENLPDDKVRLIENPKKYVEDFIESIISKKSKNTDIVDKSGEIKEISPIIKKQINSLKNSLKSHNLNVSDILDDLKDYE